MFKIVICEDDKNQIEINKFFINRWSKDRNITTSISEFFSAEEFIIKTNDFSEFNCILIDVGLGGINGIELAEIVRKYDTDIAIIFVSGYEEYIAYGYDFEAIHYLLKPLNEEKFFKCLDRAWVKKSLNNRGRDHITIKKAGNLKKIKFNNILYCESFQHYIEITTVDEKITIKKNLSDLEKELDSNIFVKTHRSYIVNINYVKEINKNNMLLENNVELPISKMRKNEVKDLYYKYL